MAIFEVSHDIVVEFSCIVFVHEGSKAELFEFLVVQVIEVSVILRPINIHAFNKHFIN